MDFTNPIFTHGVHNLLPNESIPADAAQDALGYVTQDGRTKLVGGRKLIGDEGTSGMIRGLHWGVKRDGTQVCFRKIETKIQVLIGTTWTDVVTGLTSGAEYTFQNYSSLAGTFVFATGVDGIYKFHTANPTSYISLYNPLKNDKGKCIINKGRMTMWDLANASKTTLKQSKIDPQNSSVYQTATNEVLGTGDGVTKHFTGTLAFKATDITRNAFGLVVSAPVGAGVSITNITKSQTAQVTAAGHGLVAGDYVWFTGVVGMTEINGLTAIVRNIESSSIFYVFLDSSGFTAYSSGGTMRKAEAFVDNNDGTLTSKEGGTGTINYVTGAFDVTFFAAPINAANIVTGTYQHESSNSGGITDFTFSATRLASEGDRVTQDIGGDRIMAVLVGQDGAYYSLKEQSTYRLLRSNDDTTYDNNVFASNMGISAFRAAVSADKGIVFMNTANPDRPEVTILIKSPLGVLVPDTLFRQFDFAQFNYDDCFFFPYERFILVGCRTPDSATNNRILLCNIETGAVDISPYEARMAIKDNSANLYVGSPLTQTVHQIYNGFDDLDRAIENYWISGATKYTSVTKRGPRQTPIAEYLKKFRRLRIKGLIGPSQVVQVYVEYDDAGFTLIGTIRGDGTYVDYSESQSIGANYIGEAQVGGDNYTSAYAYFIEIKPASQPKFRKRAVKLVATGIGYFDFDFMSDWDIMIFENRMPKRFRQKQRVSLDGTQTNQ